MSVESYVLVFDKETRAPVCLWPASLLEDLYRKYDPQRTKYEIIWPEWRFGTNEVPLEYTCDRCGAETRSNGECEFCDGRSF